MNVALGGAQLYKNCLFRDTSRMALSAPSNRGAHQARRAVGMRTQGYDRRLEGLEARMGVRYSVRRPSPSIQARYSTTKVAAALDRSNLFCSRFCSPGRPRRRRGCPSHSMHRCRVPCRPFFSYLPDPSRHISRLWSGSSHESHAADPRVPVALRRVATAACVPRATQAASTAAACPCRWAVPSSSIESDSLSGLEARGGLDAMQEAEQVAEVDLLVVPEAHVAAVGADGGGGVGHEG